MQSQQSFIWQVFSQFISVDWTLVIHKYPTLPVLCCHIIHGKSQALSYRNTNKRKNTDLSREIYSLRTQRLMGITTRARPRVSGDEEGGGWAEDEAVSTFKRSAWHDCQFGEYFGCVGPMVNELKRWWLTAPLWSVGDGTREQSFG